MQFHTFSGTRLTGMAAITCTAILLPAAASAGLAATAGSPASGANPVRSVTAYVISGYPGTRTVTPINTATGKPGNAIKVGGGASAIAITPNGKIAYVANGVNGTGDTVIPIDTATNKPGKAIMVGKGPGPIAITPNGKTAYVVNGGSDTVTPISTAANTALKSIKVGRGPVGIAITPNGKTAYVVNGGSDTLTPIQTTTNKALKPIKVGTRSGRHRDHPERANRVRRQLGLGHSDPDPDRHQRGR